MVELKWEEGRPYYRITSLDKSGQARHILEIRLPPDTPYSPAK